MKVDVKKPHVHEEAVQAFWETHSVYDKVVKHNRKGTPFYFMDGPPYANGHIHMGTALNKILKDIAMRSQRMQGKDVFDRPGYDTHGTPIEFQVEKEIGSTNKKDIEKYGVQKFIDRCTKFATQYIDQMNNEFKNLGVWMDWKNPYVALSDEYIASIWASFKAADEKGLLYQGKYPVHVCTRCQTAVAFNEIEYGKQKDSSIFVKFAVTGKKNTFFIIWTTTPWTLPANTGIMVHPDVSYQEVVTAEGEHWILAEPLVSTLMTRLERGYTVAKTYLGKQLEGWNYTSPLASRIALSAPGGYRVVCSARYVTTEDGTGLVHCAPGHGKEDYEVGKANGLPMPCPVGIDGSFTAEAGVYAGRPARDANAQIIADVEQAGALVDKLVYEHDYPLCWRDKSPLIMISQPQWFLKISAIQKKLLQRNGTLTWVPSWMGQRMHAWLTSISDWPVSRQRYWGAPLPIWINDVSGKRIVLGSIEELQKLTGVKQIAMHKPGIDAITFVKKGERGVYRRVPEVLDVWFDSGVSSWAALAYLGNKGMKRYWPASLNIEGRDQVRGWWNSQLILSEILFDKAPMTNIAVHGMVLDISKRKMSKSEGNVTAPSEVIAQYGRDTLRYYFATFSKGEDFNYDPKGMQEIGKLFGILANINTFISQLTPRKVKPTLEDTWILSKYHRLITEVTAAYNSYQFFTGTQALERFIIHDLSRTYIQLIRDRADEATELLSTIRIGLLQLLAPLVPYMVEGWWQELRVQRKVKEESVFLSEFPSINNKKINQKLEHTFTQVQKVLEVGLRKRDQAHIGLKWPLASATITTPEPLAKKVYALILKQLNVKKVKLIKGKEFDVVLDTTLTPLLEAEGYSRELARALQAARKEKGLQKGELIETTIYVEKDMRIMLQKHLPFISERTNSKKILFSDEKKTPFDATVLTVRERRIAFSFRRC